jgi:hypothetical protein
MRGAVALAILTIVGALPAAGVGASSNETNRLLAFAGPRTYGTGLDPESIAIGDLNRDGKQDLAVANSGGGTVSVLTSSGGRSFRRRDFVTGKGPTAVAIADLNGDRKPDLATANYDANTVSVLLNTGGRSFAAKRDYATGKHPGSVAIGDLNGDQKPDLVTANYDASTVSVLVNRGKASSPRGITTRDPALTRSRSAT